MARVRLSLISLALASSLSAQATLPVAGSGVPGIEFSVTTISAECGLSFSTLGSAPGVPEIRIDSLLVDPIVSPTARLTLVSLPSGTPTPLSTLGIFQSMDCSLVVDFPSLLAASDVGPATPVVSHVLDVGFGAPTTWVVPVGAAFNLQGVVLNDGELLTTHAYTLTRTM